LVLKIKGDLQRIAKGVSYSFKSELNIPDINKEIVIKGLITKYDDKSYKGNISLESTLFGDIQSEIEFQREYIKNNTKNAEDKLEINVTQVKKKNWNFFYKNKCTRNRKY